MHKSNKELAVEVYCAKLIADAIAYPNLTKKPSTAVPDPRDEAGIIRQIADEIGKAFND